MPVVWPTSPGRPLRHICQRCTLSPCCWPLPARCTFLSAPGRECVIRPSFVLGVEKRLLWANCFCLWVSIRVCREFWGLEIEGEQADRPTLEVANTFVCSVVFAPRGIVPFNSQPLALLVCHLTDVSDSTCLRLQAESLAYVCGNLRHFIWWIYLYVG